MGKNPKHSDPVKMKIFSVVFEHVIKSRLTIECGVYISEQQTIHVQYTCRNTYRHEGRTKKVM